MTSDFLRIAVVLGLISAIGPFAIDMYLPALPTIGADLGASTMAVQMSLLVFFLSLGFGQIDRRAAFRHVWPQAAPLWRPRCCSPSAASAPRWRPTSSG